MIARRKASLVLYGRGFLTSTFGAGSFGGVSRAGVPQIVLSLLEFPTARYVPGTGPVLNIGLIVGAGGAGGHHWPGGGCG